jgi:enamine deaminase RidA (YjgF/YER057c/UK114 family)
MKLVRPAELTDSAPYAYAAVSPPGARLVFTAGACPLDAAGATVAPGDVAAQTEQVMENLRIALQAAGAGLDDVLKTTVYVASGERADLGPPGTSSSATSETTTRRAPCSASRRSAIPTSWSRSRRSQL